MKEKHGNVTLGKLQGLPFKSATELKKAETEIDLKVWKSLTQAKAMREMLEREEFKFLKDEFKSGFTCTVGDNEEDLLRIYSDGNGIKMNINRETALKFENQEKLRMLIKTISETFANSYYSAMGIIPSPGESKDESKS